MRFMSRCRALIFAALALAGCTTSLPAGSPGVSLAQGIADAQGIVSTLSAEAPILQAVFPNALPATSWAAITNPAKSGWLDVASTTLANLSASSPVAVTNLQTAETDINLVLGDLAPVVQAVSSSDPRAASAAAIVEAAIVLAPGIEALINQVGAAVAPGAATVRAMPATARARAIASTLTPAQARARLYIATLP